MHSADLPEGVADWLEQVGGGALCQLERHVSRREAWLTAFDLPDGSRREAFFRLERQAVAGTVSLEREARICSALEGSGVPVPLLIGWDEERRLALFSRVPGTAAIDKLEDRARQRAVMEDFIDAVARLHQLDTESLGLEDVLGTRELTATNCALDDLNAQLATYAGFLKNYSDPLLSYGVQWLQRFAPTQVDRVALVQGDTGPVNFMFEDDRLTALVDWEWGHWGDPMEDLGNICVREFWNPSGGLQGLFQRYSEQAAIPYERQAVMYYRIQQNVRGMIPIHAMCQARRLRESMAWYLAYRYIGDRATCEALAEAMAVEVVKPPLPAHDGSLDPLADAALHSLAKDVMPALEGNFARSRGEDLAILVECLGRRNRYAADLEAEDAQDIASLLGQPVKAYAPSVLDLCAAIEAGSLEDEPLLHYLARHAYREEWLHWPVTRLYPDREWSALD